MQAITTKYLPATNFKPNRFKASCAAKSAYYSYDESLNFEENHIRAAKMLLLQLQKDCHWSSQHKIATGTLINGDYCHVLC